MLAYQTFVRERSRIHMEEAKSSGVPITPKEARFQANKDWQANKTPKTPKPKKTPKTPKPKKTPEYTEVPNTRVDLYVSYFHAEKDRNFVKYQKKKGFGTRHTNLSETFTENLVKWHMRKEDPSVVCCRQTKSPGGDLRSSIRGRIECKSFTSEGPMSFGPKESFDFLVFLDLIDLFLCNRVRIWYLPLSNTSERWRSICMSSKNSDTPKTFGELATNGLRPHIRFNQLKPQVEDIIEKVFEGTLEEAIGITPAEIEQARKEYAAI